MPEQEHRTFCRICTAMCGIVVAVDGHQVVRVSGDPAHPLSRGYTCPKGRALPAFHHHPARLDRPRLHGQQVTWPTLTGDLADRLRGILGETGPDGVGMYLASGSAYDANGRRIAERFLRQLGTRQKYTATTIDTPCKPLVAELVAGWSGLTPMWDPAGSRLLVLLGVNPVVSHGHSNGMTDPVRTLRSFRHRGGRIWVIDPRRTETAALADEHLAIRPSTDHLLLGWLVRELLRDGADHVELTEHCTPADVGRLAELLEPLARYEVAAATGLDPAMLDRLLAAVRKAGRVAALTGTGASMSAAANLTEWMLWCLCIVTGSYDRPGGMWCNPGYLQQLDTRAWTPSDGEPGPGPTSRPALPRRFDEYPCAGLVDEIEAGHLRALFVVGGNPLIAFPQPRRLAAALARLDVLAVVDVVETETTRLATHVLPAAGQLERADVPWLLDAYQPAIASQYTPAIVAPRHDRAPVWRIFATLGERLGLTVLPGGLDPHTCTDDDLLEPLAARSRGGRDAVFGARSGTVWGPPVFGWVHERVLPDGQWRICPDALAQQWRSSPPIDPVRTDLVLLPRRQLRTMNSQLRDVAAPGGRTDAAIVALHPEDAAERHVRDADLVIVASAHGSMVGRVRVDPTLRRGCVQIPHGWEPGNVGMLTSSEECVDPLTGMVEQSGLAISVESVAG